MEKLVFENINKKLVFEDKQPKLVFENKQNILVFDIVQIPILGFPYTFPYTLS